MSSVCGAAVNPELFRQKLEAMINDALHPQAQSDRGSTVRE